MSSSARSCARCAPLTTRVDAMLERWDEVLVQRYIDGREINVGIVGDTVLPISEIDFGAMPRGHVAHRDVSIEVDGRQRGRRRRGTAMSR